MSVLFNSSCRSLHKYFPWREYFSGNIKNLIRVSDNISAAISEKKPVVALESTIITHGLPYPDNLKTARRVESIIKENGALPATIGVKDGKLIVGMNDKEIKYLAEKKDQVVKISRRDLSYVLNKKLSGGTTVSATMVAANMAGIDVFVTGGIGGVHRGAEVSFDISADLIELSKTPVAVICSGIKSILDIGLTLEYLETQGVPVLTYGQSKYFPAFFTPHSKFQAPYNSDSLLEIAAVINNQFSMQLKNGLVIGVPIPYEYSNTGEEIEDAIQLALSKAESNGIVGKEITPFVLEQLVKFTGGESLRSNIKLIENNAKVSAEISVELSKLKLKAKFEKSVNHDNHQKPPRLEQSKRPVVIGGSIFDIKATINSFNSIPEATNLGTVHTSFGGVGRNIAECLLRLGTNPLLISSIGEDYQGKMLLDSMKKLGLDVSAISITDMPTASYSAVADNSGDLIMAIGDMENHKEVSSELIYKFEEHIKNAAIVVLDGNIAESSIFTALQLCSHYDVPVWFEPTTISSAAKPFVGKKKFKITYVSPNFYELQAIHSAIAPANDNSQTVDVSSVDLNQLINESLRLCKESMHFIDNFFITLGKHGVLYVSFRHDHNGIFSKTMEKPSNICQTAFYYPPAPKRLLPVSVTSVSGAGDSFAAGVIYGFQQGYDLDTCVKGGLFAAHQSLLTYSAISEKLNPLSLMHENINKWAEFDFKVIPS